MKILLLLTCLNLDLVTLADFSGSVKGNEEFICQALESLAKIEDDSFREALIQFSTIAGVSYGFKDKREFTCFEAGGSTNLSGALELATQLFTDNYRESGRAIVIICDGDPDDEEYCLQLALGLKSLDIKFYGVLIKSNSRSESFMKQISDYYVETDFEHLVETIKKLNFCL